MFQLALATPRVPVNNAGMSGRAWQMWGLLVNASLTFSCSSGQTGSPAENLDLSCECVGLVLKDLVQATVVSVDDSGTVELEIEQVLSPNSALNIGDLVVGRLDLMINCNTMPSPLHAGDRVFASFSVDGAVSPSGATTSVSSLLVLPWSDELEFGTGIKVPISDVSALFDPTTCDARYPGPSTRSTFSDRDNLGEDTGDCALSTAHAPRPRRWWFSPLLVGLAALGARRRRRRRATR